MYRLAHGCRYRGAVEPFRTERVCFVKVKKFLPRQYFLHNSPLHLEYPMLGIGKNSTIEGHQLPDSCFEVIELYEEMHRLLPRHDTSEIDN
jgi:hypothetical protein